MHSPDALSYIGHCAPCPGNKPQCGRNTLIRAGSFAGPFLQLRVLCYPERYAKTEALMFEAPVFQALSNFAMF